MFFIDLILPFFLEFKTDDGRIIRKMDKIAQRYIRSSSFKIDLIAIIPWVFVVRGIIGLDKNDLSALARVI